MMIHYHFIVVVDNGLRQNMIWYNNFDSYVEHILNEFFIFIQMKYRWTYTALLKTD